VGRALRARCRRGAAAPHRPCSEARGGGDGEAPVPPPAGRAASRSPSSIAASSRRASLIRRVAVCALAACLATAAAHALELAVEAPPELAAAAARVRALEGADLAGALSLIGLADPGQAIRVVLAGEDSTLAARAPSWVAGYALGPLSTIVLFPARVPSYPDRTLEALVVHEITHILVARAAAFRPLPRWYDEGLATVAAREWSLEDRARTALALIGQRPESLAEVTGAFSGDATAAGRAYALSASFMRYTLRRFGRDSAARTLAGVAAGARFETAFRDATGTPLAEAERTFFRHEAVWNTWVPFLTSTTALWFGITALALLAIRRRRRRDAELRDRWALEDAVVAAAAMPPEADAPTEAEEDDPSRYN
jgi:hypothetical protein